MSDLQPLQDLRCAPGVQPVDFRRAMRRLTGAVCIVTTTDGGEPLGLTATAVTSLSAEPARLLACVNLKGRTFRAIADSRRMCVNVLAVEHKELAAYFGGVGPCRGSLFVGDRWTTLVTGAPALRGALAALDCVVDEMMMAHSHAVVIGEIKAIEINDIPEEPLLYADGRYATLASTIRSPI